MPSQEWRAALSKHQHPHRVISNKQIPLSLTHTYTRIQTCKCAHTYIYTYAYTCIYPCRNGMQQCRSTNALTVSTPSSKSSVSHNFTYKYM